MAVAQETMTRPTLPSHPVLALFGFWPDGHVKQLVLLVEG